MDAEEIIKQIIFIVGPFPPPMSGFSAITQAVNDRLISMNIPVTKINTALPPDVKKALPGWKLWMYRIGRYSRILKAWFQMIRSGNEQILYIPISGGWGQIYDVGTLFIARMLKMKIFIHHHSTAYIVKKFLLTRVLFGVAGLNATQIVLCDAMMEELMVKYGCSKFIVLSNLAFFPGKQNQRTDKQLSTIGYLSNITAEKGGWEIIELARSIKRLNWPLQIIVAGPCMESDLESALKQAEQDGVLQWRGPVYEKDKQRFWQETDVFVFPTIYRNEAEPLVVWEALNSGMPVIAYDRGCIRGQIGSAGFVVPKDNSFAEVALEVLEGWMKEPERYKNAIDLAYSHYNSMRSNAETQWESFIEMLVGKP